MLAQITMALGMLMANQVLAIDDERTIITSRSSSGQIANNQSVRKIVGLELWEGARVGMTVAEVQKEFPEARANNPTPESANNLGELPLLVLHRGVEEGDVYVEFMFKEGHLSTVGRVYGGGKTAHAYTADEIRAIIRRDAQRFGSAGLCKPNTPNGTDCIWIKDGLAVGAFAGYGSPMLYVVTTPERPAHKVLLKQLEAR